MESVYAENFDQLIATVNELRACGFTVLVDDLSSGYPFLDILSNIELDIPKIDVKFLDISNHQNTRGSSTLESITLMGRWLGLWIVAEGMETCERADRLLNFDYEYMQGYYFHRPVSRDYFCELPVDTGCIDIRSVQARRLPSIDLEDLFHKGITSEAMLSNTLGGITLYGIKGDTHLQILAINDRYYRITGCNAVDLQERSRLITRQIHPRDMPFVRDIFHETQEAEPVGVGGTFRWYCLNGELMWMYMQAFFLHEQGDHKLFCGSISGVSTTMSLQGELPAILQTMPEDMSEHQAYPDERLSCHVINAGLSLLHNYTTQELQDILEDGMLEYIDERDYDEVMLIWSSPKQQRTGRGVEFRLFTKTGETIWAGQHIRYTREEEGVCIYNSLLTDVAKIEEQEDELLESQYLLHHLLGAASQRDSPRQLAKRSKEHVARPCAEFFPGGMIRGFCGKGFPLYFANEEIIYFLGCDSYQDLYQGTNGMMENTIYQEDRIQVEFDPGTTLREGMEYTTRYRVAQKDGSPIWGQDRGRVICKKQGHLVTINTYMDINEIVKARQLLQKVRWNRQSLR